MYDPTKPYKHRIKKLIQSTWSTPYAELEEGVYSVINRKFDLPEVDHTDGLGTKGYYHWQRRTFREAVIDAMAMNLNDLALMKAVPYKMQNHIVLPEDDHAAIEEIVTAMAQECIDWKIAITGGETSIHNNLDSLDLSMTVTGFIENRFENRIEAGDVLIGLASSGLHSNGFTKVRAVFGENIQEDFTVPTRIYLDKVLKLKEIPVSGMMHITGGAFTKLHDIADSSLDIFIHREHRLRPQTIFQAIYSKGVLDEEMYKTFNCGIGYILSVPNIEAEKVIEIMGEGEVIGKVTPGSGKIFLDSLFSDTQVVL